MQCATAVEKRVACIALIFSFIERNYIPSKASLANSSLVRVDILQVHKPWAGTC